MFRPIVLPRSDRLYQALKTRSFEDMKAFQEAAEKQSKDAKAKDIPGFEVAGEHIGQELQSLEAAKASLRASDAL